MISSFEFWLVLFMGRLVCISRLVPTKKFTAFFALRAAFVCALLVGFSLPTQRVFIMIAVLICCLFWNARYQVSFRLLLAVFVVLLLNPLALTAMVFSYRLLRWLRY